MGYQIAVEHVMRGFSLFSARCQALEEVLESIDLIGRWKSLAKWLSTPMTFPAIMVDTIGLS